MIMPRRLLRMTRYVGDDPVPRFRLVLRKFMASVGSDQHFLAPECSSARPGNRDQEQEGMLRFCKLTPSSLSLVLCVICALLAAVSFFTGGFDQFARLSDGGACGG
jgi:hypothetical protein